MKKCKNEKYIDDYLMDKLDKEQRDKFEEHYFNCHRCFNEMQIRNRILSIIQANGQILFQDEEKKKIHKEVLFPEKIISLLTPRQWALIAFSAVIVLVLVLTLTPPFHKNPPQFTLDQENIIRGEPILLISPVPDIKTTPTHFKWKKLKDDAIYEITLYAAQEIIWTGESRENIVYLPLEIQNNLQEGLLYSWQVKAFSPQGALIAVSKKTEFKISPTE